MTSNRFLLYGANGYSGELITRFASAYDLKPVLAGRNKEAIQQLAEKFGFDHVILDINNKQDLLRALKPVSVVVNAAGPFVNTATQMIEACLESGTHYIDINGDIDVFESIKAYDNAAKQKNIMLLPGAGFDVVPTDCMALWLKQKLPNATHLKLAFASIGGGLSHGTAMTVVNKLGKGGAERINGKITRKSLGEKGMWVDFGKTRLFVMSIPWGDVSTSYFTTGIPNMQAFTAVKHGIYRLLKFQGLFNWLLRTEAVKNILRRKIKNRPAGPNDEKRSRAKSLIWGEAKNSNGEVIRSHFSCADGYTLTAHSSLLIARKILQGDVKPGYQTPASAYGTELVKEIPGTDWPER